MTITDTTLAIERRQGAIEEEARLDGIYVIRTPLPAAELGAAETVTAYKNLKYVDFRHIKSDDLDLRPVFHRLEKRVRGHVLVCMLAAYLSYQGLIDHLATLARNELGVHGTRSTVPVLTDPTSRQQEAFDLIGAAIPLTLKQ